jgi:hypothetical protein
LYCANKVSELIYTVVPFSEAVALLPVDAAGVVAGLLLLQATTLAATAKPKVIFVITEPVVFI